MSGRDLTRIWSSKKFKRVVKKKAADRDTTMIEVLDDLAESLEDVQKKRRKRDKSLWEGII